MGAHVAAKQQEAKKEGAGEDDLSMEEILQSIRKIIAEDGDEPKAAVTEPATNGATAPATAAPEAPPGSDVLELTEMVKDDGSVVNVKDEAAAPAADILNTIDAAIGAEKPAPPAAPVATAPPPPPVAADPVAPIGDPARISADTAAAASATFRKFQEAAEPPLPPLSTTPSPLLASGKSVEGMVVDMLRPMMKDWLDRNLPSIVERIVTIEIRKLTK